MTKRVGRQRPLTSETVRTRSSTVSSSQTAHGDATDRSAPSKRSRIAEHGIPEIKTGADSSPNNSDYQRSDNYSPPPSSSSVSTAFAPPWTPSGPNATCTTEDSDTDFQSAYSTSPRESYVSIDDEKAESEEFTDPRLADLPEIS